MKAFRGLYQGQDGIKQGNINSFGVGWERGLYGQGLSRSGCVFFLKS